MSPLCEVIPEQSRYCRYLTEFEADESEGGPSRLVLCYGADGVQPVEDQLAGRLGDIWSRSAAPYGNLFLFTCTAQSGLDFEGTIGL